MGRRDEKKAEKRQRLDEAGLDAFLAEGFAAASVERIAAAADVARGTFYLYHPDKAALFRALLARWTEPVEAAVAEARDALTACPDVDATFPVYVALGMRLAEVLLAHPREVRLWFVESRQPGLGGEAARTHQRRVEALAADILAGAASRGLFRPHDSHAVALAIVGGIERLVWAWLEGDPKLDAARLPEEITRLFRRGLGPG